MARQEILDNNIGRLHQPADDGLPLLGGEVEGEGPPVTVDGEKIGSVVAVKRRTPMPGVIAYPRPLDLEHVGTEVQEELGRIRAWSPDAQVEHANARQQPPVLVH